MLVLLGVTPGLAAPEVPPEVGFAEHVAPILFEHCTPCHNPGGAGPFNLLTYQDARRRARQIVNVTARRYMPPWLPEPHEVGFLGERRLDEDELATLRAWVEHAMPEGDPQKLPAPPDWNPDWHLGPPDLVLEMPQTYTLRADGPDVYRNFVIPVPIDETRFVRTVEFRPGNAKIVHHSRTLVDRTPVSRYLDAESPEPGFGGMDLGTADTPGGHLLGWTPGKVPYEGRDELAFRLDPGDDLVLQLHMVPTGKPETVRARLGLYFADRPPTLHPYAMVISSREIDIPPGEKNHVVSERYTLPVDVRVLGVYPHAHYVGKEMQVYAQRPDGSRRWLIHIRDWDFNWQDEYRYTRPVELPGGSTIVMEYRYDNSSDNVRNPSYPPRRVVYGPNSTDEMAEVLIQALPRDERDRATLREDFERYKIAGAIRHRQQLLAANPDDAQSHAALASSYVFIGRPDLAVPHFEAALRVGPESAGLHQNLAYALRRVGRLDEALTHYRRAIELAPDSAETLYDLGQTLRAQGKLDEALVPYRRVMELRPEMPAPMLAVAWILATRPQAATRDAAEAIRLAERAAGLTGGGDPRVLDTLAAAYAAAGQFERAAAAAEQALGLAKRAQETELARQIGERLRRYIAGKPYRQVSD